MFERHSADAEVLRSVARAQPELQLGLSGAQLLELMPGQLARSWAPLHALQRPPRLAKTNLITAICDSGNAVLRPRKVVGNCSEPIDRSSHPRAAAEAA